ncbi:universal stress protein A-like protein [Dendronephthya gigantea]|uniref:universal stress protein A-like protein n=1 Tax=Dendronephthya gigantea TaxID=151771 RepID=UPI00106B4114|nr:universal stress protein A-like protein [Dendronephthya gigantea]
MATETPERQRVVLIPVDASELCERAFHWYVENMHHKGDKIIIFHCHEFHPPSFPHSLESVEWKKLVDEHEGKLKALEDKYKAKCEAEQISTRILIHGGHVGPAIVKCSETENVTSIVIASRGHGTLRRTVLGSTSDFVLHHAHVPVIIVHKDK